MTIPAQNCLKNSEFVKAKPSLNLSFMDRLFQMAPYQRGEGGDYDANYVTKLKTNYRSHRAILNIFSELFYDKGNTA